MGMLITRSYACSFDCNGDLMGAEMGQLTVSSMAGCKRVPICRSRVATTTLMVLISSFFFNQMAATETLASATAAATAMINTGRLFNMWFSLPKSVTWDLRRHGVMTAVPKPTAKA
jgi:hypothetical protein